MNLFMQQLYQFLEWWSNANLIVLGKSPQIDLKREDLMDAEDEDTANASSSARVDLLAL